MNPANESLVVRMHHDTNQKIDYLIDEVEHLRMVNDDLTFEMLDLRDRVDELEFQHKINQICFGVIWLFMMAIMAIVTLF